MKQSIWYVFVIISKDYMYFGVVVNYYSFVRICGIAKVTSPFVVLVG
jgi:hypothetical protein